MRILKKSIFVLFIFGLVLGFLPCFSADELDEQCKEECKSSGFDDGYYLAPEPGAKCDEEFSSHPTDEICCCSKSKSE